MFVIDIRIIEIFSFHPWVYTKPAEEGLFSLIVDFMNYENSLPCLNVAKITWNMLIIQKTTKDIQNSGQLDKTQC